ncbi:hypothetical protein FACS1894179_10110 [Bacteroidia bacterium]|nr:hypothetical protein FACS1894169_07300 [Bacteroidia bacterium]GHV41751.1 hypothetical protein FACS1894179_10110 [Bacteroidia bacterium]
MKATEVNDSLIGKRCKCIFTGLMVTGTIEETGVNRYTAEVKVRFDEPHRWGNEIFEYDFSTARLCDGFGSLRHLEIIDDGYQTIKVTFSENIREINRMFTRDYKNWGVVNLKEWIDNYESSRFTQIDGHRAIITSEHNMEHLKEWLAKNTPVAMIEYI